MKEVHKHKRCIIWVFTVLLIMATVCLTAGCSSNGLVSWLFSAQYNENGVSHFLVVTIDEDQPREYMGEMDGLSVYMDGLDIEGTNFRSVDAEDIPVKDAVANNLVSLEEWRKYASKTKKEADVEILKFDNYEIAVYSNECIIRPIGR